MLECHAEHVDKVFWRVHHHQSGQGLVLLWPMLSEGSHEMLCWVERQDLLLLIYISLDSGVGKLRYQVIGQAFFVVNLKASSKSG